MILAPGDVVLDYSYGRPDPAAMVAAGVKAVCRYLSAQASKKNLTVEERDLLLAAGLGILLVFEEAASSPLQGAAYGVKHGTAAGAMARALGYPETVPLIVAAQDMSLLPAQWPIVADYVKAFRAAAGWPLLYAYAGTNLGNYLVNLGHVHGLWKPAAGSWSSDHNDAAVVVEQLYGFVHPGIAGLGSVDDNTVRKPLTVWDGKEGAKETMKLIRDSRTGEIDVLVAEGTARVSTKSGAGYAFWKAVCGADFVDCPPEVWDAIPVWSPSVAATSVNVPPFPTKFSGTLS